MNRIACCISGLPSPKIIEHAKLLSKYAKQWDFFIFFWNTIDDTAKHGIINLLHPKNIIFSALPNFDFDAKYKEPDKKEHKSKSFSMFYGITEVQKMRMMYEEGRKRKYDIVIRMRYDLYFIENFDVILDNINADIQKNNIIFPWERHHIGICDQFWIGRSDVMDKFAYLFDWIKQRLNMLYFVNENVIYQFIVANGINIKCHHIKYAIMRDEMIGYSHDRLIHEHDSQCTDMWAVECEEKRQLYYNAYISNKNTSANTIYFMTKQLYCTLNVKIQNISTKKFMSINYAMTEGIVNGTYAPTIFTQHVYSPFLVIYSFIVHININMHKGHLFVDNNDLKYKVNIPTNTRFCQFYIFQKTGYFLIMLNLPEPNKNGTYGNYLCMTDTGQIRANGEATSLTSQWNLILV